MAIGTSKVLKSLPPFSRALLRYHYTLTGDASPSPAIPETIEGVVRAKAYRQIPNLLKSCEQACRNPNPFLFLSDAPQRLRMQVIDEILQSFITIRPRYRPRIAYSSLLFYTLQSPDPFPLSLAVIQQTLRCGCVPIPQARVLLSSTWMEHRHGRSQSVRKILSDMKLMDYNPDANTCNYLLSCLCSVDQLKEAVSVLKGMSGAGCAPDLDCYDTVIRGMCKSKRTVEAVGLVKDMVEKLRLTPRQGTLVEVAWTLRAKREMWQAVELVEFLEREGQMVGPECHEVVVNGCLECGEYLLVGKAVMGMTKKGFIPRIEVRQEIVQRLADIGEWKVAFSVRQRFAELRS